LWLVGEAERLVVAALNSTRVRETVKEALDSDTARDVVARFFASGLFDEFVDQLLASPALWRASRAPPCGVWSTKSQPARR
jgi:hypothetical protein